MKPLQNSDIDVLCAIFPDINPGKNGYAKVNLDMLARKVSAHVGKVAWHLPQNTQQLVDLYCKETGALFTYGGYGEDRSFIWDGVNYIRESGKCIHLGVDINVPADTPVHSPIFGRVLHTDFDNGEGDWGGSAAIECGELVYIFAHLDPALQIKRDDYVRFGQLLGIIGTPSVNGGWFSHLHIQAVQRQKYLHELDHNFPTLDGYCTTKSAERQLEKNRDPLDAIGLILPYAQRFG